MQSSLQSLAATQVDVEAYLRELASSDQDKTADSALWLQNLSLQELASCLQKLREMYTTEELCTRANVAFVGLRCSELFTQSNQHFAEHGIRVVLAGVKILPEDDSAAEVFRYEIPWSDVRPIDLDMLQQLSQLDFMQIDFIGPDYSTWLQSYDSPEHAKSCGVTPDTERFLTMIGRGYELPDGWPYLADKDRWKAHYVAEDVVWQPFLGHYDQNRAWVLDKEQQISLHAQTAYCMPTFMLRFVFGAENDAFDFDNIH